MNYSPAFKWAVGLFLPLTLVWKLAARTGEVGAPAEAEVGLKIADFLVRQHFTVAALSPSVGGLSAVRATAGTCHIIIAESHPIAWNRDVIRRNSTPSDHVFVVFHGKVYADQPTSLTVSDFLWTRLRRELGFNAQAVPVLAVIAAPYCGAEQLPWDEFR